MTKYTMRDCTGKEKEYEVTGKAEKLFEKWAELTNAEAFVKALKKSKLTPYDYHALPHMLHEIAQNGKAQTINKNVANWFERNGCTITNPYGDNVNFEVIL